MKRSAASAFPMRFLLLFFAALLGACTQPQAPFTLVETNHYFDPAGNPKAEASFLVAVNRDGSRATVDLDPKAGKARQILDAVRKTNTVVDPASRSATTSPLRGIPDRQPCRERFSGIRDASVSVEPSAETIHNIPVLRVSVDWPGVRRMDVFLAPSLGCQMLRVIQHEHGRSLETMTTKDLRAGNPDPDLFTVPAGYRRTTTN
jgi:hypothetical protein